MEIADHKDKADIVYTGCLKACEKLIHDHPVTKCKEVDTKAFLHVGRLESEGLIDLPK